MSLLLSLLVGSLSIYVLFMILIAVGLWRLRIQHIPINHFPKVSVVIAARNEENNLSNLLDDLTKQDYLADRCEVIIADDRSTDNTWAIIQEYSSKHPTIKGVKISTFSSAMTPKKNALTAAIKTSSGGEFILSTDADCRVPKSWVSSMVRCFTSETGVVVGLSTVKRSSGILSKYQFVDFFALMTANAGAIGWKRAWSGSGQNLAYRRSYFDKIEGFSKAAQELSGDDMFLVQKIGRHSSIKFNCDPKSFVTTASVQSLHQFFSQQIRWASNTKKLMKNQKFDFLLFLLSTFFTNALLLVFLMFPYLHVYFLQALFIKIVTDLFVFKAGAVKFRFSLNFLYVALWETAQLIYIPFTGILGLIGRFKWK